MQIWHCDTVTLLFCLWWVCKLKRTIPGISASSVVILHLSKVSIFFSLLIFFSWFAFAKSVSLFLFRCGRFTKIPYDPHWGLYGSAVLSAFPPLSAHFRKCTYNDAALIYGLQSGCELQDNQSWRCLKLSRSALIWVYVPVALVLVNIQLGYITAPPTPRPIRAWQEREPSGCGKWEVDLC